MFFSRGTFSGQFRGIYNFEIWNFADRAFLESALPNKKSRNLNFRSKCNFIRPKVPCGMLFRLKILFYPPKSPLRDAFRAQYIILSAQKAPTGRFSSSKYNFICQKQSESGTELLIFHCFATKIIISFHESIIMEGKAKPKQQGKGHTEAAARTLLGETMKWK